MLARPNQIIQLEHKEREEGIITGNNTIYYQQYPGFFFIRTMFIHCSLKIFA